MAHDSGEACPLAGRQAEFGTGFRLHFRVIEYREISHDEQGLLSLFLKIIKSLCAVKKFK